MTKNDSTGYPGDNDKTVFIPRPGGRGPTSVAPTPPPNFGISNQQKFTHSGVNPLVSAAAALVALPAQLRAMASHNDVMGLRRQVLEEFKGFENQARTMGINPEVTDHSRYVLCASIDEAVLNTIWGSTSAWANQGLLSTLYHENIGGEKFFIILDRLLRDPNADLDLLELMFICISLGFKGRYGVMDRGQEKLEELRNIVFEHIRRRRGECPHELSPHWQSQSNQRTGLRNYVPLWVVAAVAGALLVAIFIGFTMVLDERSDPVYEALQGIGNPPAAESSIDD